SATKMSLSDAGAPGSTRVGAAAPDADAWKAILFPSGDQDAELPHVNGACADPSMFIRNRCVVLAGWPAVRRRLLSKMIRVPSGEMAGRLSPSWLSVRRRAFVPSASIR